MSREDNPHSPFDIPHLEDRPPQQQTLVLSVTSGKGGVGKTNVAVNLGLALTRLGKKVLIFDTDLGLANVDLLLNLHPQYTLHDVLTGARRIEEIVLDGPDGLRVLPAFSGVDEVRALTEAQRLELAAQFEAWRPDIDVLLLDTGAGIGPNVMFFNVVAQHILVVVTPEPTSITDAYALMKVLSARYREKRFLLLVNMAHDERQGRETYRQIVQVADRFLDVSINYLGAIPRDPDVTRAVQSRRPLLDAFPHSPAAKALADLAQTVAALESPPSPKGNIQFLWRRVLQVE